MRSDLTLITQAASLDYRELRDKISQEAYSSV